MSAVCLEALFARTALSALSNVSKPNCSTYALPATSSVTAGSSACSDLNWEAFLATYLFKEDCKAHLFKLVHEGCGVDKTLLVCIV